MKYETIFRLFWHRHLRLTGNKPRIRFIHSLVCRWQRRREDAELKNHRDQEQRNAQGRASRIRARHHSLNCQQAIEWKAVNGGRTSHPKHFHAAAVPHPLLRAYRSVVR